MKKSDRSHDLEIVMRAEYAFYNCFRKRFLATMAEDARVKMDSTAKAIISFRRDCERELEPDDYPDCYDRSVPLLSKELLDLMPEEPKPQPKKKAEPVVIGSWSQLSLEDLGYMF